MSTRITPATYWNRIAERYAAAPMRNEVAYAATMDRVRAHLSPKDHVLELGCGTGTTALTLAGEVAHVTASDYAEAMLAIARTRAKEQGIANIAFTQAAVCDAPAGPFDAVLAFNLMHLLPDMDDGIAAAFARLKPSGLFISKTICISERAKSWKMRLALRTVLPVLQMAGRIPRFRKLRIADYDAALIHAGFEIVETGLYPESPANRFVVARKPG